MKDFFERIWHPQRKETNLIETSRFNIVERCPAKPGNYNFTNEAWFQGKPHPIQRLGEALWVAKQDRYKGYYSYQIVNFSFQDGIAEQATGAHFYIPEGKASNTILFTDRKYRWRARAVSGAGWIQAWHPQYGLQEAWVSPDRQKNPVFEFGHNWIVCMIASKGYGEFIVEGVDLPEYKEEYETKIPEGQREITLDYKGKESRFDISGLWGRRGF